MHVASTYNLQFRIPAELMEAVEALAIRNDCERAEIARKMVEAVVKLNTISPEEREFARKVLDGKANRDDQKPVRLVLPEPPDESIRHWDLSLPNSTDLPDTARTRRAVNSLTVERGPKVVPHE